MPAENADPVAINTIQSSRWPTLISFRGLLLVANGICREGRKYAGLCSVLKPAAPAPPCTVSVPNLITDRPRWLDGRAARLNIRRLMYQTLIWAAVACDETRRLGSALHSKEVKGAADPLIDGVRGDFELGGDFLRGQMLVDEAQAIELARAKPRNPARDQVIGIRIVVRSRHRVGHPSSFRKHS